VFVSEVGYWQDIGRSRSEKLSNFIAGVTVVFAWDGFPKGVDSIDIQRRLDMLLIPEILVKCGDWHDLYYFGKFVLFQISLDRSFP
jgi:hypothetical protein